MHMRLECLGLNAFHSHRRHWESAETQRNRELCPCCHNSPEAPTHFFFRCPAYSSPRSLFLAAAIADAHAQPIGPGPAATETWRVILANMCPLRSGLRGSPQWIRGGSLCNQAPLPNNSSIQNFDGFTWTPGICPWGVRGGARAIPLIDCMRRPSRMRGLWKEFYGVQYTQGSVLLILLYSFYGFTGEGGRLHL